jgi:hypothetical protein
MHGKRHAFSFNALYLRVSSLTGAGDGEAAAVGHLHGFLFFEGEGIMKRSSLHRPLLMFAVLLLAALACMPGPAPTAPPPTAPPAIQVQQTDAPVVTEAPPTEAPASQYFTEEFDTDTGNWSEEVSLNSDDGDVEEANVSVSDGRLVFDLGKELIAYRFYDPYEYENVRVDVRVENRGTNKNDILLICRASDEGHYLVNIANSGLFAMYAYDGAKQVYTRIADGGSNKIKAGKEVNEYSLICKDRDLKLYINGIKTREYTDNRFVFRNGRIGVGVASENLTPVTVEFDWVKISEP